MDKWLNNNTAIRIVSVLLALVIWAMVHLDTSNSPQTMTSNMDTKVIEAVPITASGLDEDRFILTAMESTVARIVVEGRISSLLKATNSDYMLSLDLSDAQPGIQQIPIQYRLPDGLTLVDLAPNMVTIQIEELETRTVEVEILTSGEPMDGYIIGESSFTSEIGNVVEITMPKEDFSLLDKVAVTVDVTEANAPVESRRSKIEAIDSQGNVISHASFNPETLNVLTDVTLPSKDVPVQLRYSGQLTNELSVSTITTEVETVKIFARQEQLDLITIFDGATVDLAKVTQSGDIMVKLETNDVVKKVDPLEIPVKVEIVQSQPKLLERVPITVIGLTEGQGILINELAALSLDVPIKGAPNVLARLNNTDVVLTLDVTNLEVGRHEVTLTAELPAYVITNTDSGFSYRLMVDIVEERAIEDVLQEEIEPTTGEAITDDTSND